MYHLCHLCSFRAQEICFFRNICNLNSICQECHKCRNTSGYIIAVAWPFLRNSLKSSFICRLLLRSSMCSGKMRTWRRWWSLRTSCCAVLIDVHAKIRVSKSGWDYVHGSVRCDGQGTQPAVDVVNSLWSKHTSCLGLSEPHDFVGSKPSMLPPYSSWWNGRNMKQYNIF